MKLNYFFLLILIAGLVSGCSTATDPVEKYKHQSATQIFQGGEIALAKGKYSDALKHFEALEALYPFNEYAEQAQLNMLYAYYQEDDNTATAAAAERFIRLYPRSPHVDYAYYMKGLADYEQDRGWLQRITPTDLSARDAGTMRQAFDDFNQVVRLYPNSVYAPDARQRMIYLRDMFAGYELHIANFYFKKQMYIAAANRANYIVQHFQGTPHVEAALGIMVKSYRKLGLQALADQAIAILQLNFPNGQVLKEIHVA